MCLSRLVGMLFLLIEFLMIEFTIGLSKLSAVSGIRIISAEVVEFDEAVASILTRSAPTGSRSRYWCSAENCNQYDGVSIYGSYLHF